MWDRLWCKSPAAYAGTLTAVTISVCVGDAVGDTGTIMAWRVNWSENFPSTLLYPPPSGETVAASLSSNYERVTFTLPFAMSPTAGSHAASVTPAWSSGLASPVVGPQVLWYDWAARPMYGPASANYMWSFDGTTGPSNAVAWTGGSSVRIWSSYTGSTMQLNDGTDTASGAFDGTFGDAALTALSVGGSSSAVSSVYGVITKVCADPNPLRCR
jgi:hypothetical protein